MPVEAPFELLEMSDGEVRVFHVRAWDQGIMRIRTTREPEGKDIKVLRLFVPPDEQPIGLDYWDLTSSTLIPQLMPYLQREDFRGFTFTIRAFGERPRKRFTVEARPTRVE